MTKMKFKLSPGDKLSIFIATVALFSTIFTTYIQFFHKTTDLQIGNIDLTANTTDSLNQNLDINILLLNTGENPVALTEWYTFLSADESLPKGACYNNNINRENNALYTFGCGTNINQIIEPNMVEFIDLGLTISNIKLSEYIEINSKRDNNESPYLNVGMHLTFVDSNGKKVAKEMILGDVQFFEKASIITMFNKNQKELKIY